jgi:hypothetical protein
MNFADPSPSPIKSGQTGTLACGIHTLLTEDFGTDYGRVLQLMGERSQVPQYSLKPKTIRPVFQWLTEK